MTDTLTETRDILYAGTVEIKDLAALLDTFPRTADTFFLGELLPQRSITDRRERRELLYFARLSELDESIDPAQYTSGRIFCPQFELRWSQNESAGQARVVYLGEEERELPGLTPDRNLKKLREELETLKKSKDDELRKYYLFGSLLDNKSLKEMDLWNEQQKEKQQYYAEVRVPRLLLYPKLPSIVDRQRVQLLVCEYIDPETGDIRLFRFQDLQVAEEKP